MQCFPLLLGEMIHSQVHTPRMRLCTEAIHKTNHIQAVSMQSHCRHRSFYSAEGARGAQRLSVGPFLALHQCGVRKHQNARCNTRSAYTVLCLADLPPYRFEYGCHFEPGAPWQLTASHALFTESSRIRMLSLLATSKF